MAVPSNENYVASLLIGAGSRSIEARMASVEGILQYGPQDPEYFPDIDDRKMSIFGYDENGNPGYWSGEFVFSRVPYALEIDGTPVDGDIEYNVTGTVSYSTGLGVNSALPATFQRIPDYNTKVAFSTTGAIFLDIDDATDLPYGQGYFTGSQFWLELKTDDGVSRFYGTSSGQIEDVTNWTAFTGETGANTISVSPPVDVTIAAPGQMIESLSDTFSIWFRGNNGLHRIPEIDEFGFLRVNGVLPRTVTAEQLNNVPRAGEPVTLPDHNNCTAVGDGTNPVSQRPWDGLLKIDITEEWAAPYYDSGVAQYFIPLSAFHGARDIELTVTEEFSSNITLRIGWEPSVTPVVRSRRISFRMAAGLPPGAVIVNFGIVATANIYGGSYVDGVNEPVCQLTDDESFISFLSYEGEVDAGNPTYRKVGATIFAENSITWGTPA